MWSLHSFFMQAPQNYIASIAMNTFRRVRVSMYIFFFFIDRDPENLWKSSKALSAPVKAEDLNSLSWVTILVWVEEVGMKGQKEKEREDRSLREYFYLLH